MLISVEQWRLGILHCILVASPPVLQLRNSQREEIHRARYVGMGIKLSTLTRHTTLLVSLHVYQLGIYYLTIIPNYRLGEVKS